MAVAEQTLYKLGESNYLQYSVYVNEDRAIPCNIDGLKPSYRRALWTLRELTLWSNSPYQKAAKVVGHMLGNFHPHGDSAAYDAMVTMAARLPIKLIDGSGNWGNFSSRTPAAQRYTLCRMSKFAEAVFFDRFYLPITPTVLNYDSSSREPLILNSLLPNILLNGTSGIGVGAAVNIPSFTLDSVIKLLKVVLKGTPCTAKLCAKYLEFTTLYEATPQIEFADKIKLMQTGKGSVKFFSKYEVSSAKREAYVTQFATFNKERALAKATEYPELATVNDVSDIKDKHGKILLRLKTSVAPPKISSTFYNIINDVFSSVEHFEISATHRSTNDGETHISRLHSSNVVNIINEWVAYRLQLEKDACRYWIAQREKEIAYQRLMQLAFNNLDFIVKTIRTKKLDNKAMAEFIAKKLKIKTEQALTILGLKLSQLKALDYAAMTTEIKRLQADIAQLKIRRNKPAEYVLSTLDKLVKTVT